MYEVSVDAVVKGMIFIFATFLIRVVVLGIIELILCTTLPNSFAMPITMALAIVMTKYMLRLDEGGR